MGKIFQSAPRQCNFVKILKITFLNSLLELLTVFLQSFPFELVWLQLLALLIDSPFSFPYFQGGGTHTNSSVAFEKQDTLFLQGASAFTEQQIQFAEQLLQFRSKFVSRFLPWKWQFLKRVTWRIAGLRCHFSFDVIRVRVSLFPPPHHFWNSCLHPLRFFKTLPKT